MDYYNAIIYNRLNVNFIADIYFERNDISMNKECETFTVENAYFSIGKVIPFNVPVEIPRCLAESIKEIKTHKVITLSEENQRIQKRLSNVIRVPRYNVVIQEK